MKHVALIIVVLGSLTIAKKPLVITKEPVIIGAPCKSVCPIVSVLGAVKQ